jgi:hypothetical protein
VYNETDRRKVAVYATAALFREFPHIVNETGGLESELFAFISEFVETYTEELIYNHECDMQAVTDKVVYIINKVGRGRI